eukprot:COSAG02_NODE_17617_length_991_cov_1.062780_2_plen_26_part_01
MSLIDAFRERAENAIAAVGSVVWNAV